MAHGGQDAAAGPRRTSDAGHLHRAYHASSGDAMSEADRDLRSIQQARRLAERASTAASALASFSQEQLDTILDAMQSAALPHAEDWAGLAVEETGFGNVGDKILKNLFSTVDLHRHIRPMRTVGVLRQDEANRVLEIASPVGVVAAIIPSTNPTST